MSIKLNNIAVLIDADNASANNIEYILQKIETLGRIACKKIYGDWGNAHIQSWQEALLKYAIDPMQQFAYVKGKNATDIGMVIEAMDLLYSGNYDGFCLISSDSDFTSLALRIRKSHMKVFGFGKKNTVSAFAQACDNFYYVEDLLPPQPKPNDTHTTTQNFIKTPTAIAAPVAHASSISNAPTRWTTEQLQTQTHLISALTKLVKENPSASNGWSNLSYLAKQLNQNYENIKLDKYGYKKFSDLIAALSVYDIRRDNGTVLVKLKAETSRPTATVVDSNKKLIKAWNENRLKCDTKLLNSLRASIINHPNAKAERWVNFGLVGNGMKKHYPTFEPTAYGYAKLADIVANINLFETKLVNSTLYVRHKKK